MSVLTQIKWNNANQDQKPQHMQIVLVCVDGVYYITLYDEENNQFRLREDPGSCFNPENQLIYWTEFVNPKELEKIKYPLSVLSKNPIYMNDPLTEEERSLSLH